jgi:hypothetical protein
LNRRSSKVALFNRLVTKLEQTLEERDRIEHKLDHLREAAHEPVSKPHTITTLPAEQGPPAVEPHNDTSVCMVVQRYRGATIMCDEAECIHVGKTGASLVEQSPSDSFCGLMVYVSFAQGCTQQAVKAASKIIVNLPILTTGAWGDGVSKTMNVIDLAKHNPNAASIVIVPQANLINKVCICNW